MTNRSVVTSFWIASAYAALGWPVHACGGIAVMDEGATSSNTSSVTTGGSTTSTGVTSSTTGGGNACVEGIDTPCETCAATSCTAEMQNCANLSECDAQGNPTAGCLALLDCAAMNCNPADDALCVAALCAEELESAGGPTGEGTSAAQQAGDCMRENCAVECGF